MQTFCQQEAPLSAELVFTFQCINRRTETCFGDDRSNGTDHDDGQYRLRNDKVPPGKVNLLRKVLKILPRNVNA